MNSSRHAPLTTRRVRWALRCLAPVVWCAFAAAPAFARAAPELELRLHKVDPEAAAGKQVTLKVDAGGAGSHTAAFEALIITPSMDALPVPLELGPSKAGVATYIGRFTPAVPGEYEFDVLARLEGDVQERYVRKRRKFDVRRGNGIVIKEGPGALQAGDIYPGEVTHLMVHPGFASVRGDAVEPVLGKLKGPGKLFIDPGAVSLSPGILRRGEESAGFKIEISLPTDQPAGKYAANLTIRSKYDECIVPLHVNVLAPELRITPSRLDLGRIQRGRSGDATLTLSLAGRGLQPVRVTLQPWIAQAPNEGPGFYVEGLTRNFVLADGSSEMIKVTVRAPDNAPTGKYESALLVKTPLRQFHVPVEARVVRPPMVVRTIAIIALAVLTALLFAACLWDLHRTLTGRAVSPMRRYLLISGFLHSLGLLISLWILLGPDTTLDEYRIAVRAVRMAGERGVMGEGDQQTESFLSDLASLDEDPERVELEKAESAPQQQEKDQAEARELAELYSRIKQEIERQDEQAKISERSAPTMKAVEAPSEAPNVAAPELREKHTVDQQKPVEAQTVELAASEAKEAAPKRAVAASSVGEMAPRNFAPQVARASARPEALRPAPRVSARISTPTIPAVESPKLRPKAAVEAAPETVANQVALAPAIARKATRKPAVQAAAVRAMPTRRLRAPLAQTTVARTAKPITPRPETTARRPEPREMPVAPVSPIRLPVPRNVRPRTANANLPDEPAPDEPKPITIALAMAMPAGLRTTGAPKPTRQPAPPHIRSSSSVPLPRTRQDSMSPLLTGAASGKSSRTVGLGHQVSAGKIVMGTARYSGDWDCDKTAMPNLAYQLEKRVGLAVETETKSVRLSSNEIFRCAFLFLSGHSNFTFQPAEIRQLKRYLEAGGALWLNDSTHEGDTTFDAAIRRELNRLLPGAKLEPIPMDAPIFSACYDLRRGFKGYDIPPGDKYRENRLHGIRIAGRWAVVYSRNDYGDGLEIDPNTHPLMKSLTNLSPSEMQEGSIRIGMNLTFHFLNSARGADDVEKLKLTDMQRTVAALPEVEERSHALLAGKILVEAFQPLKPQDAWKVPDGWSHDTTALSVDADGRIAVDITHGRNGKNVVGRAVEGDLSSYHWLVMKLNSRMKAGGRMAVGISTGENGTYFESAPKYIRPGENPDVVFDLTAATFKSEGSGWKYEVKAQNLGNVRAIHLLFYPISGGRVTINNIKLAK